MARFYGDTRDLIDNVQQIAVQAGIALDMAECRYCKSARTRALDALLKFAAAIQPEVSGLDEWDQSSTLEALAIKFEYAGCKAHRREQRLAYINSPVSEIYWA